MIAPSLEEAVRWQNDVPFGLTAGFHSLDEEECAWWIDHVEAGNLYVNRGITGAIVRRQPFGGWKRSSVGATAKAGGQHYVSTLRHVDPLSDVTTALEAAAAWFSAVGGQAIDVTGLRVEHNVSRYRRPLHPHAVRLSEHVSAEEVSYLEGMAALLGITLDLSSGNALSTRLPLRVESVDAFVERIAPAQRVRWISRETAPTQALLARGVSCDLRPLAQRGDIEASRWLLEQSVAVTHHRYGNVHAGPKPRVRGLADL
jgi:RHH-type proline utilization regulon transcriptional repressor/proline dehydrogenase/delta 1-pyrroline-5-carboxylate dehydrogenase